MKVPSWLDRAAAGHADRPAIETEAGSLSYAALRRAAAGIDLPAGERVAIALPPGLDFAVALHACLRSGAVAVPVDPRLSERERAAVCAGAALVIAEPIRSGGRPDRPVLPPRGGGSDRPGPPPSGGGSDRLGPASSGGGSDRPGPPPSGGGSDRLGPASSGGGPGPEPDLGARAVGDLTAAPGHDFEASAVVDPTAAPGHGFEAPVDPTGARDHDREAPAVVDPDAAPEHDLAAPAVVIHTSGTTGSPRPAVLTYGNLLWSALGSATAIGLDPAERWLCPLPVAHVGGLSILVRSVIYATTAVVHERFDTAAVLAALMDEAITVVSLVPTTLARLLDAGLRDPPRLRCALIGGAPLPPALISRALAAGVPVSQTYGLSEAASQVTTQRPGDGGEDAGPPLFCTRVRIRDGEIQVAGPTVAPAAGGWLATGDLGELVDGRLRVTGRRADTIISGGENIAPTEVEAALADHPAVAEAAAVGVPDPDWGEAVRALVVLRPGAPPVDAAALREHCRDRLAAYKVPKDFVFVDALPRTRSGKLARRELAPARVG